MHLTHYVKGLVQSRKGVKPMSIEITKGVIEYSKMKQGDSYFCINGRRSNFKVKEFACNDGTDKILIDSELVEKLQIIREYFGKPVIINSAYRTSTYNKKVGGATNSQHVLGKAADIRIASVKPSTVADFAKKIGFRGVGIYSWGCHLDTRVNTSYWNG